MRAFQYDEVKTLKWLKLKCRNLCTELQAKNFHIGAKSAYFIKSEKFDNDPTKNGMTSMSQHTVRQIKSYFFQKSTVEGEFLAYAFGMVCEYIPASLVNQLSAHLGLEKINPLKRKSMNDLEHKALKRVKSQEDMSLMLEKKPAVVPEKKVSAKEKKMAKAASGTKSISSFFKKK